MIRKVGGKVKLLFVLCLCMSVFRVAAVGPAQVIGKEEITLHFVPDQYYQSNLFLAGATSLPNTFLQAEINGFEVSETESNANGDFVIPVPLESGLNQVRITGIGSTQSGIHEVFNWFMDPDPTAKNVNDKNELPPQAPILDPPVASTSNNPIILTGSASPDTTVRFFVNGRLVRSVEVDASGIISTWIPLEDGDNDIYALAESEDGVSPISGTVNTVYSNEVPRDWSGTIDEVTVWTPGNGEPYELSGHLEIDEEATLWLQPGVRLEAQGNYKIQVKGNLVIKGKDESPVVLRSNVEVCNGINVRRRDWQGIEILEGATGIIEYAEFHCANKAVHFKDGDGRVENSQFLNNYTGMEIRSTVPGNIISPVLRGNQIVGSYNGIYMEALSAEMRVAPKITASTIKENNYGVNIRRNASPLIAEGNEISENHYGLHVYGNRDSSQDPDPRVNGNSIYGNTSYNYYVRNFDEPAAVILDATGNWWGNSTLPINPGIYDWSNNQTDSPLVDYSGYLDGADGEIAYDGGVIQGRITEDLVLEEEEYLILGRVEIVAGAELTIGNGVEVKVGVDQPVMVDGRLVVAGTESSPVIFKPVIGACDGSEPRRRDWLGIVVSEGAEVEIKNADIYCANKGIHFDGGNGLIENSRFLNNYTGIEIRSTLSEVVAAPRLIDNEVKGGYNGVYMESTSPQSTMAPVLKGNDIYNNYYAIQVRRNTAPIIDEGNRIFDNTYGLYVIGNTKEEQNPAPVMTGNSVFDNSSYNYYATSFENPALIMLDATNNWWGSVEPGEIASKIYDWSNNQSRSPVVDYREYLDGVQGAPAYRGEVLLGSISEDQTLVPGDYLVLGRVELLSDTTLTIESGVEVKLSASYPLLVKGDLVVTGTQASPVIFKPVSEACDEGDAQRQDWPGIEVQQGGSINMEYAEVHCASKGIYLNDANGLIRNSLLLNNYTGVEIKSSTPDAAAEPQLMSNKVLGSRIGIDMLGESKEAAISPQLIGNEIQDNTYGIHVRRNTSPVITDGNVITENQNGVYVLGNHDFEQNPAPVTTNNSIYENSGYNYYAASFGNPDLTILNATGNWWGTTVTAAIAGKIRDWSNAPASAPVVDYQGYLDGAGGEPVYVGATLNGAITEATVLNASEYEVQGNVSVMSGATLSIEAGVELNMAVNAKVQVLGELLITGTDMLPVVLRSSHEACNDGDVWRQDWIGIEVEPEARVDIEYAEIRCATRGVYFNGGDGKIRHTQLSSNHTAIRMEAASPTAVTAPRLAGNEIKKNKYGIQIGPNVAPIINDGNRITDNEYGLHVEGSNASSHNPVPTVTGNSIHNNSRYNYFTRFFGEPERTTLDASGNWWGTNEISEITSKIYDRKNSASSPFVDYSGYLGEENGVPDYAGESLIGLISKDLTLSSGDYRVLGDVIVVEGVTLTLKQGVRLFSAPDRKIQVSGSLVAEGTQEGRVVFSAMGVIPEMGDWYGIEVLSTGVVDLNNVRIEFAKNGVDFNGGQGVIRDSLIRNNEHGISIRANSNPLISGNEITANRRGIYVYGNGNSDENPNPTITGNALYENDEYSLSVGNFGDPESAILNVSGNWWGTSDSEEIASTIYRAGRSAPEVDYTDYMHEWTGRLSVVISNVTLSAAEVQPLLGKIAEGSFEISEPAVVTVQFRRESDHAVVYQSTETHFAAGEYAFSWDGRDNQGSALPEGFYRVALIADDGVDPFIYDAPLVAGGSVSGSVPKSYEPYKNSSYKILVNMAQTGLLTMEVTPEGGRAFDVFRDKFYLQGQHWVVWDGRGPDGGIIDVPVSIYYPVPERLRATAIYITDTAPSITGLDNVPNIEVKSDPYLISHSYEQVTRMAYRINTDAYITFSLLPPGVVDPADPSAISLIDGELLQAIGEGGQPIDHVAEWRGHDLQDPKSILVGEEGVYTFAIQARSPETDETTLYRGVVNLYR